MTNPSDKKPKVVRQFPLTNFALDNKISVYLLIFVLFAFGMYSYRSLPKELFPDIVLPTIYVQTIYPGNPPVDMENLITRPIEKQLDVLKGIKEINSTSSQDISSIFIEFNTGVDIKAALQDVKDAIDKAKSDLPDDLTQDPTASDIDFTEFPIIYVNLSGDFTITELKKYAEFLQDEIERVPEISKVDIKGLNDREIKVNIDPLKMESMEISFTDIENAIGAENISMSGGLLKTGQTTRSVRIIGEFNNVAEIENIIVKHENGNIVYLKDIGHVVDGFADPKDFARLNNQPVVSLHVIKKGGENLLSATDQIFAILDKAKSSGNIPQNLTLTITNDQSEVIRKQLTNLENSMIMGVILVIVVLYFFLGTRNALFVGFAIPLSMFISFIVLGLMGSRINMIVLFSLILALGMLVDNAIVVVENIFRYVDRGYSRMDAARQAVGEIAMPIISSTATTLAAFFPLLFWKSMMGEFMKYLPLVLVIVLTSSLFVALVIIPVVSSSFINPGDQLPKPKKKRTIILSLVFFLLSAISYAVNWNIFGSLLAIAGLLGIMNIAFLNRWGRWFQSHFLPWLENIYLKTLTFVLHKYNPFYLIGGTIFLLFFTLSLLFVFPPKIEFFPSMTPRNINILAVLPVGTDITSTDDFMKGLEKDVYQEIEPYKGIIKSVLTTVGNGAKGQHEMFSAAETPNKGLITITFVDYEDRGGINTFDILKKLGSRLIGHYPGIDITVEKEAQGPPVGNPINLEITGQDFDKLIYLSDTIKNYLDEAALPGIEGLKSDLNVGKPEAIVHIDRDRARRYGLSTAQIAGTIRTALFGKEVSHYKEGEDKYPIELRLQDAYRYHLSSLMNQKITFRNPSNGKINQVPISAVADITFGTTFDAVKRKDLKRIVTIYSNVLKGYNATDINNQLKALMSGFNMPAGYTYKFTGEQKEQDESMAFLERAMLIAIALIMIILVSQFNSVVKPLIIMASVIFSTIGVFVRRFRRAPRELAALPLAAGVATVRALRGLGAADAALKWPNDLLVRGAKIGGILIETRSQGGEVITVSGVGINCRPTPGLEARLGRRIASLEEFVEHLPSRNGVAARVAGELLAALDEFDAHGLAAFKAEWEAMHAYAGQRLRVRLADGRVLAGIADGLADDGGLRLRTRAGVRAVRSGRVVSARAA